MLRGIDNHPTPVRRAQLHADVAAEVRRRFGTPCYVYDRAALESAARAALAFPAPFGLTLRYAMKANPSRGILTLFRDLGLHVDASSDHEVERALRAGFSPERIQLTSQMPSRTLKEHVGRGVLFNACSLHQLEEFGRIAPGGDVSVRMNPGLGTVSTKRTNTGGPASSFGIWHEAMGEVAAIAKRHRLRIRRLHSHVGSGTDPEVWKRCARMTLDLVEALPDVATVNLGGGFKVGRMPEEPSVDLADVGAHVRREIEAFRDRDGRTLHLEIEPGTFLVANAGVIVASCVDVVDTGADGYAFAKLDAGMPEITRPSLYGAQHPIDVLARGREQPRSSSWGRAASRAIFSRRPPAIRRRSRRAGCRARRSATWWWWAGRARTAPAWRPSTTTPTRRLPRSCSTPTGASRCCGAARCRSRSRRTRSTRPGPRYSTVTRRAPRPRWTARSRWACGRDRWR
jgi:diaminopimelate decarboxylase